jgi:hypothetical protein
LFCSAVLLRWKSFRQLDGHHGITHPRRHGSDRSIPDMRGRSSDRRIRDLLLQALMGASSVEVGSIGLEHPRALLLAQNQRVIEALAAMSCILERASPVLYARHTSIPISLIP